jgi:hypothetical protein
VLPALHRQGRCFAACLWHYPAGFAFSVASALHKQWHCFQQQQHVSPAPPAGWLRCRTLFLNLLGQPLWPCLRGSAADRAAHAATQCFRSSHRACSCGIHIFIARTHAVDVLQDAARFWPLLCRFCCCLCVSCLPLCNKKVYTCSVRLECMKECCRGCLGVQPWPVLCFVPCYGWTVLSSPAYCCALLQPRTGVWCVVAAGWGVHFVLPSHNAGAFWKPSPDNCAGSGGGPCYGT